MKNERTMMKDLQEKMGWTEEELEAFIGELKAKLMEEDAEVKAADMSLEQKITNLLRDWGFTFHIKGTPYLRAAIIYMVNNGSDISVTRELYPAVAKKFNTTAARVERATRHSIESAYDNGNPKLLEMFGYSVSPCKGKPTNSEFMAMIADQINQGLI